MPSSEPDYPVQTFSESLCKFCGLVFPSGIALLYSLIEGGLSTPYGAVLSVIFSVIVLGFQLLITLPLHHFLREKCSEYLHWYLIGGFTVPALVWLVMSLVSRGGSAFNLWNLAYFGCLGMMVSGIFGLFRVPFLNK